MEIILLILLLIVLFSKKEKRGKCNYRYKKYKQVPYGRKRQYSSKEHGCKTQWNPEWVWDESKQMWVHSSYLKTSTEEPVESATNAVNKEETINFADGYQAKKLLTDNERAQYKKLKDIAEVKGYVVCPKVRLFDVIEPRKNHDKYKTLMYKIQAKHVDFVICDKNMSIKSIVELDDSSHDRPDRKERDAFVDLILRSVGYKVIHVRYITNDILDLI